MDNKIVHGGQIRVDKPKFGQIMILFNFPFGQLGSIITRYDFLEARQMILRNISTGEPLVSLVNHS